ncbi:hypothetical protein [uncultured Agitococcus sp.]|uniref:hypothetical protein n=1 Tax=uncultured Agitococcus sp. TaxID=1506599 RepID=UPI002614F03A|nr:hypothetical protein [uncultured Agitococcus sp.]
MWSSAVIYLSIQPRDAWQLTPFDFWALWDTHLDKMEIITGKSYSKPMSLAEFHELNEELDKIHGNN